MKTIYSTGDNFNGCVSEEYPIHQGVPQRSILDATLFIIHLDDIDNCLRHCIIIKYSNDTVLFMILRNIPRQLKQNLIKTLLFDLSKENGRRR